MRAYLIASTIALANVVLALAFFSAGFYVRGWTGQQPATPPPTGEASLVGEVRVPNVSAGDDPARGPAKALVTVIEFSDFQCPFCKAFFHQTLPRLIADYGTRVRFVYRDFPINQIHPEAQQAAEAAQCAFEQGRFWEYHDRLFQHQETLAVPDLKRHARALGLDATAFERCLESREFRSEVEKDLEDGRRYGVNGTPTFFINGRKVVGAQPQATFKQIIEEELARARNASN